MSHLNGGGIPLHHMHQGVIQGQGYDTTLPLDKMSLSHVPLEGGIVHVGTRLADVLEGGDMLVGLGADKTGLAKPHVVTLSGHLGLYLSGVVICAAG
jgi:hypothetical protein